MERHRVCSCCDLQLSFNPQCDNTWTINQSDFAEASGESSSCHHPCDHIEHGVMKLKVCVAVNHTTLCYGERNLVTEEKTYYSTQPCADSGPSVPIMGLVPLLLLLLKLPELTLT
ncbi:hypothetical protein D4764_10G0008320 [Takifugu flavidus]|uniref:Uncharacterized protein n=2 Tax=Takifugu flavidus TaxID=433684 RepID=A0A5C6PJ02_9TELE|nr:hypothetical protein D4764_10G0008320 [Takifugu flavidus]